jgi:hypothetical protein
MSAWRGLLLLAAVAAAAAYVATHSDWARLAYEDTAIAGSDYELHWAAGRALAAGLDPYDQGVVNEIGRQTGRAETPFCAANPLVVRMFAASSLFDGYRTWRAWNVALLGAAVLALAACLRRELGAAGGTAGGTAGGPAVALALALGLVALNDGTWMSFFYNQTNVVTLLLVALALLAAQSGRSEAEGVLLALATAAKTSPALLLVVAALAGRWRTVVAGVATLGLLGAVSIGWNGLAVNRSYLAMVNLRLSYASSVPTGQFNNSLHDWNVAPNGLLSRAGQAAGWPPQAVLAAAGAAALVVLVALERRLRPRDGRAAPGVFAQYAAGIAATFLVSSVTWPTHLSLAAVPCGWLAVQALAARRLGALPVLLLLAGALATAVLFVPLGSFGEDLHQHDDIRLKTDACLALFAVTLLWPQRDQPPTAAPSTGRTKASDGLMPSRK